MNYVLQTNSLTKKYKNFQALNGLDPQGIVEFRELILKRNRERHITVLISSHIGGRW